MTFCLLIRNMAAALAIQEATELLVHCNNLSGPLCPVLLAATSTQLFELPPSFNAARGTLCWESRADQCCTKLGQLAYLVNLAHLAKFAHLGGSKIIHNLGNLEILVVQGLQDCRSMLPNLKLAILKNGFRFGGGGSAWQSCNLAQGLGLRGFGLGA